MGQFRVDFDFIGHIGFVLWIKALSLHSFQGEDGSVLFSFYLKYLGECPLSDYSREINKIIFKSWSSNQIKQTHYNSHKLKIEFFVEVKAQAVIIGELIFQLIYEELEVFALLEGIHCEWDSYAWIDFVNFNSPKWVDIKGLQVWVDLLKRWVLNEVGIQVDKSVILTSD